MVLLILAMLVLATTMISVLWRRGVERKHRWSELSELENAPFDNAVDVAGSGINRDLVHRIRLGKVLSECGHRSEMREDLVARLAEILKTSPATLRVLTDTQRLYKEAAARHPLAAAFRAGRLSAQLNRVLMDGRVAAAAEPRWTLEMCDTPEFAEKFENDQSFEKMLAEHGLKIG